MTICDVSLDEGARRGDEAACVGLVECYRLPLYNLGPRMLGEAGEAEDATQETFWRVYLHWPSDDPWRGFKSWLFVVATRDFIDGLRRRWLTARQRAYARRRAGLAAVTSTR